MNTIVYVGMDVHKESYTLCCYSYDTDKVEYKQTIPADYKLILKYMERVRKRYGGKVTFVCGYEAGCLGYSLYHQLKNHKVDCKILYTPPILGKSILLQCEVFFTLMIVITSCCI